MRKRYSDLARARVIDETFCSCPSHRGSKFSSGSRVLWFEIDEKLGAVLTRTRTRVIDVLLFSGTGRNVSEFYVAEFENEMAQGGSEDCNAQAQTPRTFFRCTRHPAYSSILHFSRSSRKENVSSVVCGEEDGAMTRGERNTPVGKEVEKMIGGKGLRSKTLIQRAMRSWMVRYAGLEKGARWRIGEKGCFA